MSGGGSVLGTLIPLVVVLGIIDFDVGRPENSERREIAGNRVTFTAGSMEMRPFVQDLLVAQILCFLMVWFGVRELLAAAEHVAPLWNAALPPPLGGVSLGRCVGHTLVGTCLLALGSSGLFRAGITTGITIDRETLRLYNLFLAFFRFRAKEYPRTDLERFELRRAARGPRPFQVRALRTKGRRPVLLLSLVPAVGRSGPLEKELGELVKHLNAQLGVETIARQRLATTKTAPGSWSLAPVGESPLEAPPPPALVPPEPELPPRPPREPRPPRRPRTTRSRSESRAAGRLERRRSRVRRQRASSRPRSRPTRRSPR